MFYEPWVHEMDLGSYNNGDILDPDLVMCRLGLEALSRPKPAFKSLAEPRPRTGLQRAGGSGFKF